MNKTLKSILFSAIVLTQVATPVMANSVQESVYSGVVTNLWAIGKNFTDAAVNTATVTSSVLMGWMPKVLKQATYEGKKLTGVLKDCPVTTLAITGFATYKAYSYLRKKGYKAPNVRAYVHFPAGWNKAVEPQ